MMYKKWILGLLIVLVLGPHIAHADDEVTIANFTYQPRVKVLRVATNMIEDVAFRDYIKGVVQGEIGSFILASASLTAAQKTQAYRAQAVAAALVFQKRKRRSGMFDITDTDADQVYETFDPSTYPLIIDAVDAVFSDVAGGVAGKIVKYNGSNVETSFYGHRNGESLNSEDSPAFGNYNQTTRAKFTNGVNVAGATRGHGVGGSQAGFRHFAAQDKTYDKILKYYYQPRPPFLEKVIVIQDTNKDKAFNEASVYEAEWRVDPADKTKMNLVVIKNEEIKWKYHTKFILFYSERMDDGSGGKALTLFLDEQKISIFRIRVNNLNDPVRDTEGQDYGTIGSGTGVTAGALGNFDRRVAVGVLAPKTFQQAKLGETATIKADGVHIFNTLWKLDSDPASRAWANIEGTLERYTGGSDEKHTVKLELCPEVSFIIDDTGSMGQEIGKVRSALSRHLDTYPDDGTTTFQLTTFKDGVSERAPTTDLSLIKSQVDALRASGGGDCPEASVEAINQVKDNIVDNGRAFVATDAAPHEGLDIGATIADLRARGIRVDVIVSGDCVSVPTGPGQPAPFSSNDGASQALGASGSGSEGFQPAARFSAVVEFSRMARETGGIFAYLPGVNSGFPSAAQRFENAVFNIVHGGITSSVGLVAPSTGPVGSTLTVTLAGVSTNFQSGNTTVGVEGDGITVTDVDVRSSVSLQATLNISPGASLGFRDVVATTNLGSGPEEARGDGAFEVISTPTTPTITGVAPPIGEVGQTLTVLVDGVNTHFDDTSVLDMGTGITVVSTAALSQHRLQATLEIADDAFIGFRSVRVTTGSEVADENVLGPFFVSADVPDAPRLITVTPPSGAAGAILTLAIEGVNTAFADGASVLSFSSTGIDVLSTTVTSPSTLTAEIEIVGDAPVGSRDVRVTTGAEVAVLLGGFFVTSSNAPPRADAGEDQALECTASDNTPVILDGSGSFDPNGDPMTYTWREGGVVIAGPTVNDITQVDLDLGVHTIELTVDDGRGATDTDEVVVTIEDTRAPVFKLETVPTVLWPPDLLLRTFALEVFLEGVIDACDATLSVDDVVITSVSSDELNTGSDTDITSTDIVISSDCGSVSLRAKRRSHGNGRVYTIDMAVADASGNVAETSHQVHVPLELKEPAIDGGPAYTVAGCTPTTVPPGGGRDEDASLAKKAIEDVPTEFMLGQNYPNPFNPITTITFALPETREVELAVFDVMGRRVATLVDGVLSAGYHEVAWNAEHLPTGVYLYRITAGDFMQVKQMMLVK